MSLDLTNSISSDDLSVQNVTITTMSSQFLYLLDFFNTSRSGSAQSSAGISFQTFMTSLMISLIYCIFQCSAFSLLRCKMKNIYQPNCYYVADKEKIEPVGDGFFSWVPVTIMSPIAEYKKLGLDAYFFIRYLTFLLILFLGLLIINVPVLIPVNYISGYSNYTTEDILSYTNGSIPKVSGLDSISMSNIAPKYTRRLTIHLTMAIVSVFWFHGLVLIELWNFIRIKNDFLSQQNKLQHSDTEPKDFAKVILIDNIPTRLLRKDELKRYFENLFGAKIEEIWFVYNYKELKPLYRKHLSLVDKLEDIETFIISKKFFEQENYFVTDSTKHKTNFIMYKLRELKNYNLRFIWKVVPILEYRSDTEQAKLIAEQFISNRHALQGTKSRLAMRDLGPLNDHKYNKVFIKFDSYLHPQLLDQIQISNKINELDNTLIYINPKDIIWANLSIQSNMQVFVRTVIANFLECFVIVGWVIPVAFIGLISQLPYLTVLVPFLKWLNLLPSYITDVFSNLLSVFLLMSLAEAVPFILRWLSFIKCKRTGAEVELDVQRWMFIFLFIHIFLVVTISSGFSVIIEGVLNNPVSIPNILATNLPKCSNFFLSYMIVRGLSYFGNNLIQNWQLLRNLLLNPFTDWTPRKRFMRLVTLPVYKWGSIYPSFSILGTIGLVYCILSPLILVFCCLTFFLALISFKYSLKYQFSHKNPSENFGQLYPRAIFQLYSGIYFMEICLIGLFLLARDENHQANCLCHALLTFGLLVLTAIGQSQVKSIYGKLLSKNLPLNLHEKSTNNEKDKGEISKKNINNLSDDTFYQECFQHKTSIIWLPNDDHGISNKEIEYLKDLGIDCSNSCCELTNNGELVLQNCPPDYVE